MKIKNITIQGFRGIRDKLELDIPPGFLVICGRNGAGKSTICDSIEFALTGKIRDGGKIRDAGKNREGNKIQEKGEDYSDYIWWKGTPSAIMNSVKLIVDADNECYEFLRNDNDITSNQHTDVLFDSVSAPSDALVQLIRTSLIRDESITEFSVDLQERDRFEFAKNAIGQIDLSQYIKKADSLASIAQDRFLQYETEYNKCRDRISELTARLSELKSTQTDSQNIEQAQKAIERILGKQYLTIVDLLNDARSTLGRSRNTVDGLLVMANDVRSLIDRQNTLTSQNYLTKLDSLGISRTENENRIVFLENDLNIVTQRIAEYESGQSRHRSLSELESHGRKLGLIDGHCPLCGLDIVEEGYLAHLDTIKNEIISAAGALGESVRRKNEITDQLMQANTSLQSILAEMGKLQAIKTSFEKELQNIRILLVQHHIQDDEDVNKILDNILSVVEDRRKDIITINDSISSMEASSISENIQNIELEIESVKSESETYFQKMNKAKSIQNAAKASSRSMNRFAGEIVDEQLSSISPLLSEIFSRLKPHIDWKEVNYRMRGDVRRFLSLTIGSNLNPSFMFSSGQRRALGLAFLISVYLARPWAKLKTLILDDPVQHIDDYRALHLTETLAAIRKQGHQIICTVEDRALAELLCRRLRSTYDEPGALVEMEYKSGSGTRILSRREIMPMNQRILKAS